MKRNSSQLFWGFFLVTIGLCFLAVKYDYVTTSWSFVWDLWPLVLVFWGIFVLIKQSSFKPIVSVIFGIFMWIMIYGSFLNFSDFSFDSSTDNNRIETYETNFSEDIETASLKLSAGVGQFYLERSTTSLVKALARGNVTDYKLKSESSDKHADVVISTSKHTLIPGKSIKNRLEITINRQPVWDLEFNLGASETRFDLSDFKVRNLELNTGASDTYIKLGSEYDRTDVSVDMGAAALKILIPQETGCEFYGSLVLSNKELDGFVKEDDKKFRTENFNNTDKKIYIKTSGAISDVKIIRY
ncbi:MAG: DUF5668 domain-containing protein [Melioribacteraceae bacterium]|nr:DUF5668 domain-containing protein [Melioribacteraceae bacterium]